MFEVGIQFTVGAPAGSAPPEKVRTVVSTTATYAEALVQLDVVRTVAQVLQTALNAEAAATGLGYIPLPSLGWFAEQVADALSAVTGGGEDLSALGEPPPIVLPDDHGDFVTRIVPVTAATDLNGNPISDLSVLTYTPQTSDATVIARTVDPADRLTVHNHVGRVGTARIWIDVGWGVGQVFSTPVQPIEVVAGTLTAVTGMGEDFSRSGLPAEEPDSVA